MCATPLASQPDTRNADSLPAWNIPLIGACLHANAKLWPECLTGLNSGEFTSESNNFAIKACWIVWDSMNSFVILFKFNIWEQDEWLEHDCPHKYCTSMFSVEEGVFRAHLACLVCRLYLLCAVRGACLAFIPAVCSSEAPHSMSCMFTQTIFRTQNFLPHGDGEENCYPKMHTCARGSIIIAKSSYFKFVATHGR